MGHQFFIGRAVLALLLVSLISFPTLAVDLRQRARENPLDCALFLMEQETDPSDEDELADAFQNVSRYDDSIRAMNLSNDPRSQFSWFSRYAVQLDQAGDKANSEKFIKAALAVLTRSNWWSREPTPFIKLLISTHRDAEIEIIQSNQDHDEGSEKVVAAMADAYTDLGDRDRALVWLGKLEKLAEADPHPIKSLQIAEAYLKLNDHDRALRVIMQLEAEAAAETDEGLRDTELMLMIPIYFDLGDDKRAFELWYQVAESSNPNVILSFAMILTNAGKHTEALNYLSQVESRLIPLEENGAAIAETYLKLDRTEDAARVARTMSVQDDDGRQQRALMMLTDRYLKDDRADEALSTLNFAWQKARRVAETHRQQDSIGASPITRKIQYLSEISDRYVQLKRYDRALVAIHSFTSNHEYAREFIAISLASLAKKQLGTQPRPALFKLLDQAATIANAKGFEGYRDEIMLRVADVYAQMGESTKALALINKILKYRIENNRSAIDELIAAGLMMESNKLKADPELRKILSGLIEESESTETVTTHVENVVIR